MIIVSYIDKVLLFAGDEGLYNRLKKNVTYALIKILQSCNRLFIIRNTLANEAEGHAATKNLEIYFVKTKCSMQFLKHRTVVGSLSYIADKRSPHILITAGLLESYVCIPNQILRRTAEKYYIT